MTEGAKLRIVPELEGRVLRVVLEAPPGNVLDSSMIEALTAFFDEQSAPSAVRALILEGAGKHFSFGASVAEHRREEVASMLARFHRMLRTLAQLSIPTLAAVRGQCLGGGLELVGLCTWIFAAPEAAFGQPEIQLGVFAPAASAVLPWRLGGGRALDLCVSGRTIRAEEARAMGLVHELATDPAAAALAFAEAMLVPKSAASLRFAERAVRLGLVQALEGRLMELEKLYLEELMETPDANEGLAAFLEKRAPRWAKPGAERRVHDARS
ncbi:MAG: enoyl-CoA hydratase-related protein [Myxococcota bacterium]